MATFHKVKEQNFIEICKTGDKDAILDALKSGANADIRDKDGLNALFFLSDTAPAEVIDALIKAGADVNARAYDGITPIYWAADSNTPEVVKLFIGAGADVNAVRYDGITSLFAASRRNVPEVVKMLLKAGANVNAKNSNGITPLLYAAMNNHNPGVVDALIEYGAEDITDKAGRTALMLAAQWNVPEVVDVLIDAGTDIKAKDNEGHTALDYAYDNEKLKGTLTLQRLERLSREE